MIITISWYQIDGGLSLLKYDRQLNHRPDGVDINTTKSTILLSIMMSDIINLPSNFTNDICLLYLSNT